MQRPPIRYVAAPDGVNIAYYELGAGGCRVFSNLPNSHIGEVWNQPGWPEAVDLLARRCRFVHYDHRGFGLSQRDVTDLSLDAFISDLVAISDRLAEPIDLIAWNLAVPIGIGFASRFPERVRRLVLQNGGANERHGWRTETIETVMGVAEKDWGFAMRSVDLAIQDYQGEARGAAAAEMAVKAVDPKLFLAFREESRRWDVEALLPAIQCPTLVVQGRGQRYLHPDAGARLAAAIPQGSLFLAEGVGEGLDADRARGQFLAQGATAPVRAERPPGQPSRPLAIPAGLSAREVEVLRLVASGRTNQQIADELVIALNTVVRHVSHIFEKTGVANRAEAAAFAMRHGISE